MTDNQIVSRNKPFYVYLLLRPNGRPFYVGKGCGDRVNDHEKDARRGCECHKCRVIRKIWQGGHQIIKTIIYTTNREADAFCVEAEMITKIGLRNLCNVQDGKSGILSGKVCSQRDSSQWTEHERRYYLVKAGCPKDQIEMILRRDRQILIDELKRKRKGMVVRGERGRLPAVDDQILTLRLSLGYQWMVEQEQLWDD